MSSTAITGSGIVMAVSPEHARGKLGATIPAEDVSGFQAFGVELILTSLLVLTMLASIDANRHAARRDYGTAAALGVVVTCCYLIAVGVQSMQLIVSGRRLRRKEESPTLSFFKRAAGSSQFLADSCQTAIDICGWIYENVVKEKCFFCTK